MGVFNNERKEIKMSLNVDFKNCPNAFEECEPDYTPDGFFAMVKRDDEGKVTHRLTHICRAIIGFLQGIGMGSITEKTIAEMTERSELWQDVIGPCGPGMIDDKEDIPYARIPADDLRHHMGLSSNVHKEHWTTFTKKLRRNVQDRLHRQAREAKKKASAA